MHDQDLGGDPSVRGLLERSGGRALCCGPGVGLIRLAGRRVVPIEKIYWRINHPTTASAGAGL